MKIVYSTLTALKTLISSRKFLRKIALKFHKNLHAAVWIFGEIVVALHIKSNLKIYPIPCNENFIFKNLRSQFLLLTIFTKMAWRKRIFSDVGPIIIYRIMGNKYYLFLDKSNPYRANFSSSLAWIKFFEIQPFCFWIFSWTQNFARILCKKSN